MNPAFDLLTLARRGLLTPGHPLRMVTQLGALRSWGFTLAGELRQAAAREPRGIAVIDDQRGEVTYGQLLDRAERVAELLHARGTGPGDRLGLIARNHAGAVEVMVGASTLGADLVLLNTGLSSGQLQAVAAEQDLRAIIHDDEFAPVVASASDDIALMGESELDSLIRAADHPRGASVPDRHGHTIILTSGTTGTPKGARRRTPKGFGPLVSIIDRIPVHARDRIMIASPLCHTWGYGALQLAFGMRGTVVLQRRFDPAATLRALFDHRIDVLFAVPVMLQRLLEMPSNGVRPPLRVVATSGSALPGGFAPKFMAEYGDVLYNLYGSTEVSWVAIATPQDLHQAPNTSGRAPHRTQIAILDESGQPVPDGEVGRIFAGNDMVFEGYTNGTAKEMRSDLVSTGDVGHITDGLLFVDGREDDMIVSGGENVYPSEVEELLAETDGIREVAVVGVRDAEFGQRLAAYVVLRPGATLSADDIKGHVRANRARHCVPRDVEFLDELPRNPTGKVLYRVLRERDGQ